MVGKQVWPGVAQGDKYENCKGCLTEAFKCQAKEFEL